MKVGFKDKNGHHPLTDESRDGLRRRAKHFLANYFADDDGTINPDMIEFLLEALALEIGVLIAKGSPDPIGDAEIMAGCILAASKNG